MIKAWGPGKYYCDVCDVRENEYGRCIVTWTAGWPPPAFCWDCFAKRWAKPASMLGAAVAIAAALQEVGFRVSTPQDIRDKLHRCGVNVEGISQGRLSAMVYRLLVTDSFVS